MAGPVRLHKYLASCGVASRRKAEELITSGRVSVNGEKVTKLGSSVQEENDIVHLDGKPLVLEEQRLFLFHKPVNVLSTMSDPEKRPCVSDYTRKLSVRVFPIGRLDFDVSGLLLLTNDGDVGERLLHPRYEVPRTYWARVKGHPRRDFSESLVAGAVLEDGPGRALSAKPLQPTPKTEALLGAISPREAIVELVVAEGRNHFVKRLLAQFDYPVIRLSRVSFGNFELGGLAAGKMREIKQYRSLVDKLR